MPNAKTLLKNLLNINEFNFETHALFLFKFQATYNQTYKSYLDNLEIDVSSIKSVLEIPFMPISFFKNHIIKTNAWKAEKVFESSGTTEKVLSKHAIKDIHFYHLHAKNLFENLFGPIHKTHILALLPSYLERSNSSLVSMVQYFIKSSKSEHAGFYLYNVSQLITKLEMLKKTNKKVILFGVTFALLELAEKHNLDLSHVILIETGGMKGRREEITRKELYQILKNKLNLNHIYSEYGMTEMLSQAYGKEAIFYLPSTIKALIREVNDPFSLASIGKTGGVNIIDFANVHSCAFIETKDLGRINKDGTFEILGRFDNSELRGCNLLVS